MTRVMFTAVAVMSLVVAGSASAGHDGPHVVLLDELRTEDNAWVAWKVNLPADADSRRVAVDFDGRHGGSRTLATLWRVDPTDGRTRFEDLAGFTSLWEVGVRADTGSLTRHDVKGSWNALGPSGVNIRLVGDLDVGENIIVAVLGSDERLDGTMSLSVVGTNGPPATLIDRTYGTAFLDTEYDFQSGAVGARVTATHAVDVARQFDARRDRSFSGRLFGWFTSSGFLGVWRSPIALEGPGEPRSCGSTCMLFPGLEPGPYVFRAEDNTNVGVFTGTLDLLGADVYLDPLLD